MDNTDLANKLADEFGKVLREWLTDSEIKMVLERNKAEPDNRICHSHDFCDANQAMIDALEHLGMELDVQSDEQNELRAAAWTIARESNFGFYTHE